MTGERENKRAPMPFNNSQMSNLDGPDQVAAYASIAASTINELRDVSVKTKVPAAVEQERMIAVKAFSDAQQEEIKNLREENMYLQKNLSDFCQNASKRIVQIHQRFSQMFEQLALEQNRRISNVESVLHKFSLLPAHIQKAQQHQPVLPTHGFVPESKLQEVMLSLQQKEAEVRELRAKINHETDIISLMQQVDDFTKHATTLEDEKSALEAEIQRLTDALKNAESAKDVLNSMNLDLNAKIEDLELKLSASPELATAGELHDRISHLSQSLDKLQKSHTEQVQILNDQVRIANEHSKNVASQLSEGNERNVELSKTLRKTEMELNMVRRQVNHANTQLEDCKKELDSQRQQNELLKLQKEQLAKDFDSFIQERNGTNEENEMLMKSLIEVFGCSQEDVAPRILEMLNELARLKQYLSKTGEQERELRIVKSTNHQLEERIKELNDQMEAQDKLIRLCKDGKESEAVKGIHEQFKKLQEVNSQLIKEMDSTKTQIFTIESALNSTKAALDDERSLNSQLSSKVERFDFYEYSIGQLITVLESLSSQIVLSLNKTSGEIERQEALDGLLIELKKQNSTPESAQAKWDKFLSAMQMTIVDNGALIGQLMEGKLNSCKEGFVALLEKTMRSMRERVMAASEHLEVLKQKSVAPAVPVQQRRQIPVKRRGPLELPPKQAPKENRYMERSPVTPIALGKGGVTPRI